MPADLREQLQLSLGEAYLIERELGGGGMSRVFLALETALGRKVVVKVLLPELAAGVSVDRFRREIQLAAKLQHPHIVPLLAAGESGGLPYFTMPFVAGESLGSRILRDGELPVPEAARILRDIASALAYAHTQGVVHRDVKPDNVLLSHGVAVVTDFGVAKALTASTGLESFSRAPGLTSLGISLGTPAYMAPEQATADPAMDHRVDIYAFGVTAYEMLTGQPPFMGRTPHALLGAHLSAIPDPITSRRPGIPPLLALVVMKCLEKRQSDRPQTAAELIAAMDMLTTPTGGTVPIAALPQRRAAPWRAAGSALARPVALAAAALAIAGGVAVWAWRAAEAPAPIDAASAPATGPEVVSMPPPDSSPDSASAAAPDPPVAKPRAVAPSRPPAPAPPGPTVDQEALSTRLRADSAAARAQAVADSIAAAAERPPALAIPADSVAPRPAPRPAAPVRPPAPVPAPDPERQIRALFAEYGAAIEARSVDAIRRTYPGLLPAQAREWEDFFRGVTEVQVELKVTDLEVTGDAAEARLAGIYVFDNPSTHRSQRESVAFQAALRRDGNRWRIVTLR